MNEKTLPRRQSLQKTSESTKAYKLASAIAQMYVEICLILYIIILSHYYEKISRGNAQYIDLANVCFLLHRRNSLESAISCAAVKLLSQKQIMIINTPTFEHLV